jgi:hypothetical protein
VTKLTASVDKNPVMLDEAITLTVTAEGSADRDAFDSSALLSDFVVGRTSVNSQTQIINFDTRRSTTWTTTLFPRKIGSYTIPAFTMDGVSSSPFTVKVIPVPKGANQVARDYYVSTQVDTNSVYLQQQLLYTVKLYLAGQIERGSLQAPELDNAQIQQLGDDKQYTDIVNGKRYQVIERNFAVIPQQSGTFTIKGPVFTGEVVAANTNQRFGYFNRTQSVNRVGPEIELNVKPMPAGINYHWLPSSFVQLDEEWQSEDFVVGEPITRTLSLTAIGVAQEQLPELPQLYPPDFKLYPDQANTSTAQKDNTLISQRVESLAIIPTRAGTFVLPEIKVPWFNALTGDTEYAQLPARSIEVKAAPISQGNAPAITQPQVQGQNTTPAASAPLESNSQPPATTIATDTSSDLHHAIVNWIMLFLWLLTLVGWSLTVRHYRRNYVKRHTSSVPEVAKVTKPSSLPALNKLVAKAPANEVQQALLQWLEQISKDVTQPELAKIKSILRPQLNALMANKYSPHEGSWDRNALQAALVEVQRLLAQTANQGKNTLAPLYPQA